MPKPRTLRVLPNPWVEIDAQGRPCGVVPFDPVEHNGTKRGWVGARAKAELVKPAVLRKVGQHTIIEEEAQYDTTFEFATDPVEIPNTAYYRAAIKRGELIACDEQTAGEARIKSGRFRPGHVHAAHLRNRAIAERERNHGPGSVAAEHKPKPPAPPAAESTPTPVPAAKPAKAGKE